MEENKNTTNRTVPKAGLKLSGKTKQNAEDYLFGKRDSAVLTLAVDKNIRDINDIIPYLKQDILNYVAYHHPEFEGDIHFQGAVYDLMSKFKAKEFFDRKWKWEPYSVKQEEIDEIQACVKNPIYVNRYIYDRPIYEFPNLTSFSDNKTKQLVSGEKVKSEAQFYISEKEDVLFAKVINLKYKPVKFKLSKSQQAGQTIGQVRQQVPLDDSGFYRRSLSISMYVLLDGNPNKAMPFMRYDNDFFDHNNVWIGDDKRKHIFGEIAKSPHFHFQNEKDSIFCLRKFKNQSRQNKYRTGRCNAIDCYHLKEYLLSLDSIGGKGIFIEQSKNGSYGMPFLQMKIDRTSLKLDVAGMVKGYLSTLDDRQAKHLSYINVWLNKAKDNTQYVMGGRGDRIFGDLIKALDFLEFITDTMKSTVYSSDRKVLSDMELMLANEVMNVVNRNNKNILTTEDEKPKYTVEYDFDRDVEEEVENQDE